MIEGPIEYGSSIINLDWESNVVAFKLLSNWVGLLESIKEFQI